MRVRTGCGYEGIAKYSNSVALKIEAYFRYRSFIHEVSGLFVSVGQGGFALTWIMHTLNATNSSVYILFNFA